VPITSRRYSLWTRLYKRMLLEPTSADNVTPRVSEVVVPVIQADAILQTPTASGGVSRDISGSGFVNYFTVPTGEEWRLSVISKPATVAVSDVVVVTQSDNTPLSVPITDAEILEPVFVLMRAGDQLGMSGTGNGGDTDRSLRILYLLSDVAR